MLTNILFEAEEGGQGGYGGCAAEPGRGIGQFGSDGLCFGVGQCIVIHR